MLFGIHPDALKTDIQQKKVHKDFSSSFIYNCWNLEAIQMVLQQVNGQINCGTSRQWNIIQHYKEKSYQAMKRYGRILSTYY